MAYALRLAFDRRLWPQDIAGSMAWANALARAAVITDAERDAIVDGLARVRHEHPEIEIEEVGVLTNLPRVLRDGVLMLPTLIVGARRFHHAPSIDQLLAALEPSPAA